MRGASTIRALAGLPPVDRIARSLAAVAPRRRDTLAVLTLHRVAPAAGVVPGLLSATPEGFERLLDVAADRFRVLAIDEVLERRRGGPRLPPRSLLLTFDDAYRDMADHVWPALAARGLPATLFVPSGYPDRPDRAFWWERVWAAIQATRRPALTVDGVCLPLLGGTDRSAAYRAVRARLKAGPDREIDGFVRGLEEELTDPGHARPEPSGRVLDWAALGELRRAGLALGSHTRTHPLLTRVDDRALVEEVAGGADDLARETGSDLPAFAYPSGEVPDRADEALAAAGIRIAFTTRRGVNELRDADWLRLRRINVSVATPRALILAQAVR